jgi:hypothetical protein
MSKAIVKNVRTTINDVQASITALELAFVFPHIEVNKHEQRIYFDQGKQFAFSYRNRSKEQFKTDLARYVETIKRFA